MLLMLDDKNHTITSQYVEEGSKWPKSEKDLLKDRLGKEDYSKGKKFTQGNHYKIDFLRESLMLYRGMSNENHDVQPSIVRLYGLKPRRYTFSKECKYCSEMLKLTFMKEACDKKISLKLLARMQHYGFTSRLIDVTFNEMIAIYMASNENYESTGKVIEFAHQDVRSKNHYTNILKRYHYTSKMSNDVNQNLAAMNNLVGLKARKIKPIKQYSSEPVVVIDRSTFKNYSETYDIRYNAQDGAFIIFLNTRSNGGQYQFDSLDLQHTKAQKLKYRKVLSKNKLDVLFALASNGLTSCTVYPDSDISCGINKIISKIRAISNKGSRQKCLMASLYEYAHTNPMVNDLSTHDHNHLKGLLMKYVDNDGIIQFLLSDYIKFMVHRAAVFQSQCIHWNFNQAIDQLISRTKEKLFNYLYI